jgi:hypothetical protein
VGLPLFRGEHPRRRRGHWPVRLRNRRRRPRRSFWGSSCRAFCRACAPDDEGVPAGGALNGGATLRYARVIELVFGLTAIATYVHLTGTWGRDASRAEAAKTYHAHGRRLRSRKGGRGYRLSGKSA